MAKKRKSIFETATSNEEIKDAALSVQKETLKTGDEKKRSVTPKEKKKTEKEGKLMHLYVDSEHHRQAKINATIRGMKLGEYIQWLIIQDKDNIR